MNPIHCIGDSHASFFCGENRIARPVNDNRSRFPYFRVYHIGPVLAYSLCDTGTRTRGRETVLYLLENRIPAGSRIMLCFGEIDCRFHLLHQSELQGRNIGEVVDDCVQRYVRFALEVKSLGYEVGVWNATPSSPDSIPMDSEFPRYGTERQRNITTRLFNQLLQKRLEPSGISFLNIFEQLVNEHSETRVQYLMDQIHLSQQAMPLALNEIRLKYGMLETEHDEMDELKVYLGGCCPLEGWVTVNCRRQSSPATGGGESALADFEDCSVDEIYGADVMARLDYTGELTGALKEMYRVLKPGGRLRVSLPDFETLCRLFLDRRLSGKQRFYIMRLMFGTRIKTQESNQVGLSWEFFLGFLHLAGFRKARRVEDFEMFDDASNKLFFGYPLSLNVEALK